MPSVGMDDSGDYTVVWTSYGQDNAEDGQPSVLDYGIYARMYNANGTPLAIAPTEFRVNATTAGNQVAPAVASNDPDEDSIVAWVGPDTKAAGTTAVFVRNIDPPFGTASAVVTKSVAPAISANPGNQSVSAGQTVNLTAIATGTPAPTVQWQSSTNGGSSFTNISGATSTTYSFTATATQSGDEYRAVFTNSVGTATSSAATLVVNNAPAVTTNPNNQTIVAGQPVSFTAAASGTPAPTVQWEVSTNGGSTYTNVSGASSPTYTFTTAATQSGYWHREVFTNAAGSATSPAVMLTVLVPPVVTTNPSSQAITAGQAATFTAAASGSPAPSIQWQVSTNGGTTYTSIPARRRPATRLQLTSPRRATCTAVSSPAALARRPPAAPRYR